jgi:hypothetical protein
MEVQYMASQDQGQFVPMNALADISVAHRLTRSLEQVEARRLNLSIPEARRSVARRLQTSPGTLENLRKLRLKQIPSWLMARIRFEFVAVLQAEIRRLEHEITIAKQTGQDFSCDALAQAEAQVVEARKILSSA